MAFASHCGLDIDVGDLVENGSNIWEILFSEELGSVLQVRYVDQDHVVSIARKYGLEKCIHAIGDPSFDDNDVVIFGSEYHLVKNRCELQKIWSETSYRMQALRDNPVTAQQEFKRIE